MHDRTFWDFVAEHLQLDELTTKVKTEKDRVWLWTAVEAKCKVLLVMHLGGCTQDAAHQFIHESRNGSIQPNYLFSHRMDWRCTSTG
jgi:IS1 family transposase